MISVFSQILRVVAIGIVTLVTALGSSVSNEAVTKTDINTMASTTAVVERMVVNSNSTSTSIIKKPATTTSKIITTATSSNIKKPTPSPTTKISTTTSEKISLSIKNIPQIQLPLPTIGEVNEITRKSVVNILCETISGGALNPITGTGVIIDERGVILTNAHIAQFFLLKDFPKKDNVNCVIRTGSPAKPLYKAELLFISPLWIEKNAKNITAENPLGTGENDFAFLLITGTVNSSLSLPTSFPALVPNTEELVDKQVSNDTYVVASYPAGFLGGIAVQKDLFLTSASVQAQKIFTFKENTIDLIGLGGSAVAQKGSSGGAVVRQSDKKLVGIIVTTTEEQSTGDRDLRAIATTHINRSLEASIQKSIPEFLKGDLYQKVIDFRLSTFIYLKSLLVNELTS